MTYPNSGNGKSLVTSADAAASVNSTEPAKATYATTRDPRFASETSSSRGQVEGWLAQQFMGLPKKLPRSSVAQQLGTISGGAVCM